MAGDQMKEWCFEGDAETFKQTHVTQPTIYTVPRMAAYEALLAELEKQRTRRQAGDRMQLAGFSLGEYSALTAAGVIAEDQRRRRDRSHREERADAGGWT